MIDDHSANFLKEKYAAGNKKISKKAKKIGVKLLSFLLLVTAMGGMVFSYKISQSGQNENTNYESLSLFSSFRNLSGANEKSLTGENDDRINFLLLGVGGAGHAGPELSDTIIFASYKPSNGKVGLLSIPRDLTVPIPDYGYRKINHINAYGELQKEGYGPELASEIIGGLLNQPIHYYIKVDFAGFEQLIDAIGGVRIYVDNSFVDNTYPDGEDSVKTISFEKGWQTMDGETALMYARSRHGSNGEGSDFARAQRQQKIILAVKNKLFSASTLLNPTKLNRLINTFQDNVDTNLTFWEIMKLAKEAGGIDFDNINTKVLEPGENGTLYATTINGAYVLLPKRDDWSPIQEIAANILNNESQNSIAQNDDNNNDEPIDSARIEIKNGTSISGLAFQTSQLLANSDFTVVNIGNADSRDYKKTIIYDLTEGEKAEQLKQLQDFLKADVAMSPSGWIFSDTVVPRELTVETSSENEENIDFLIILGEDAENLVLR
ncbi:LytR family transcriptional regulator [Candidatus Parcubacteria bacterium]|nr:MAG: LytR family transcriptional regulator [Candidatus Parcubacteria bacterium]